MGDPPREKTHYQRGIESGFDDAWHEEWWDAETLLEAEGIGPMETVYKNQ